MPSIHTRPNSSQQQLSLILPKTGKRVTRSLHTADPQKAAQIGDKVQSLVDTLIGPDKHRQSVLKVLVEDIFIAAQVPNPWEVVEVKSSTPMFSLFASEYINRKAISKTSQDFQRSACLHFIFNSVPVDFRYINQITGTHCQSWYDEISKDVTAATAKNRLAAVSSVFTQAVKIGLITANPCAGIQTKKVEDSQREEFTDEEFEKIVNYLKTTNPYTSEYWEWVTAVMLARWAGLRLMDAVSISQKNLILSADGTMAVHYLARKTGSEVTVPCFQALREHLTCPGVSFRIDLLCPTLSLRSNAELSNKFGQILDDAGIDCGKHVVNGRAMRKKTFHSLRHQFCQWLCRLGMPEERRMLLTGHTTRKAHSTYINRSVDDVLALTSSYINTPSTTI